MKNTKIEWATHTFNPWEGCTKISPGCENCYAAARNHRFGGDNWGKGKPRRRTSAATWRKPGQWNKAGAMDRDRPRVFPSLCDWLDDEAPKEFLLDFLKLMRATQHLDWLLLTKRPENFWKQIGEVFEMPESVPISLWLEAFEEGLPSNVWVGVSVEDQERADERIPNLLTIPARVRFLSVEPLLGPVNLAAWLKDLDWVIIGGESGPGARACHVDWVRAVVAQCQAAGVPCFVKQLGAVIEGDEARFMFRSVHGKGGDPEEWPADLRVREFPRNAA